MGTGNHAGHRTRHRFDRRVGSGRRHRFRERRNRIQTVYATTDTSGAYSFQQVNPGTYRITVRAAGFRTAVVNNVQLLVNNPATVPVKLEIGQLSETVSVTAETEQLNTVDASIGNAISNKPIVQLPLNARNIVGLLAVQPGVVFVGEDSTDSRNGAVNGGKSDQANVTLDGVDVNDQMDRAAFTSVLRMTPDSVQEFRVTTLNANADQGRSSGAQITLVTKSGTNDLHGSLYEYHRNTATSANNFFGNMVGNPREKLIRNIYGVSAGGPIIRNRMFLFGNWEGRRDAKDGNALATCHPWTCAREFCTTSAPMVPLRPSRPMTLPPGSIHAA
jgi:hypothetical protein